MAGYVTKKTYDFYPRPPRGGRLRHSSKLQQDKGYFYPRPPRGGRLCIPCACWLCPRFLSTPSARRATAHKCPHCAGLHISIHALREEGDLPWLSLCSAIGKFLSTPSARRATDAPLIWATSLMYFYPRPLRGGRLFGEALHHGGCSISIHALCEEGDGTNQAICQLGYQFLSTPSARRATAPIRQSASLATNFYPRPLRGGRPTKTVNRSATALFLSTPSARRATLDTVVLVLPASISIHALCEEGDRRIGWRSPPTAQFLSTPSARRATCL